jgi:hypothetical protein
MLLMVEFFNFETILFIIAQIVMKILEVVIAFFLAEKERPAEVPFLA